MKSLITFLFITFISANVFGQTQKADKIIKKDNTQIQAIVTEVTDDLVKYKKYSNPTGPVYSIKKSELAVIIYVNGESEVFNAVTPSPTTAEPIKEATLTPSPAPSVAPPVETKSPTTPAPPLVEKPNGWLFYYEGGYSSFADYLHTVGGVYLGFGLGYKFNKSFSTEVTVGGGTYFPDPQNGTIGITKLHTGYVIPKITYRVHFSKESKAAIFFSGGVGYAGTSGEFQDFSQIGNPTYTFAGYDGFAYSIGGRFKFGYFGIGVDYIGCQNFSTINVGLKLGL